MLADRKEIFIESAICSKALTFGSYTLKSGRQSPHFFNLGLFCSGSVLSSLATAYAQAIVDHGVEFDVLFGPAYKGISLAALTVAKLAEIKPSAGHIEYAYNRKEAKDHGEGGNLVGAPLKGRRVLIIDDIITAGTAITQAAEMIGQAGGIVAGIVVAVDREEKLPGESQSALQKVSANLKVPVFSIVSFSDIIEVVRPQLSADQIAAMEKYKLEYGA